MKEHGESGDLLGVGHGSVDLLRHRARGADVAARLRKVGVCDRTGCRQEAINST
ncbi:hypothetical protein [Amycolatopsis sp. NPDC051903]|uniref:hypothetical protein n=1 Tax=Amycolatopsis sp. NPDC051903 TaxID=3363936 RepID=UPI0037AAD8AA